MVLWRLCREEAALTPRQAFSAVGPAVTPRRWNDEGRRVVYCAASPALALVELLVDAAWVEPPRLLLFRADVPSHVARERVALEALPPGWRDTPAPARLRDIGDTWLDRARTALLVVPSAVVPQEVNVLVSPEHPDFPQIEIGGPLAFVPDRRLVAALSRKTER